MTADVPSQKERVFGWAGWLTCTYHGAGAGPPFHDPDSRVYEAFAVPVCRWSNPTLSPYSGSVSLIPLKLSTNVALLTVATPAGSVGPAVGRSAATTTIPMTDFIAAPTVVDRSASGTHQWTPRGYSRVRSEVNRSECLTILVHGGEWCRRGWRRGGPDAGRQAQLPVPDGP